MRTHSNLLVLALALAFFSCEKKESKTATAKSPTILPNAPAETEAILKRAFPGSVPGHEFSDSMIHQLRSKYGIEPHKVLLGVSTCVDDIIYTKNFHLHPEIKGPFHLGGLGGLPFTGTSGLEAFAHHIPDSGTMLLLVEPHIGYSSKGGWGSVLRHEQHEGSSCCGALMGTLGKLKAGTLSYEITEDDYQGGKIAQLALLHEKEILASENPIIELTRVVSVSAAEQIRAHVLDVDLSHIKYIIIVTGVIINTDYMFTDYQYVDNMLVYDVSKKKFVEELKNPLNSIN